MEQLPVIWTAAQCGFLDWQDTWGDPWFSGTVLVLAYAITGILLLRIARQLSGRERALWSICGVLFVFQAFNTPLDLHSFVWTFGRCLSKAQGWYADRGAVQWLVLITLACSAIVFVAICAFVFRANIKNNVILLFGVVIALGFTGVKGISLHALAGLYGQRLGPFYVADWIELFGISIALTAVILRRRADMPEPLKTGEK